MACLYSRVLLLFFARLLFIKSFKEREKIPYWKILNKHSLRKVLLNSLIWFERLYSETSFTDSKSVTNLYSIIDKSTTEKYSLI